MHHSRAAHPVFDLRSGVAHEEVLRAVRAPTEALPGREPDEEWFYLRDAGPSRWLKVVVLFEGPTTGRIITAFPRRRKP